MKNKILMLILDGFSSTYLRRELCPTIHCLSREQFFSRIQPMFGYQGIGAAIYSGASPNTTGVFTEFVLRTNEPVASSRIFRGLLRLTDVIPNERLLANARYVLFRMLGERRPGISNVIPSKLLKFFSPKLTKEFSEKGSLGKVQTVFDILRINGMSYEIRRPAVRLENLAIAEISKRIREGSMPDLMAVDICSLDLIGHKYGPHSSHTIQAVRNMDQQVFTVIRSARLASERIITMILSDHGMSPVDSNIDLLRRLSQLSVKLGEDYLVFLDSTLARFWLFNMRAKKLVCETLANLDFGKILDKNDMQRLELDQIDKEYGELFFALKEGYSIFPDFFRKYEPPKGMHGYAYPCYDSPFLIVSVPGLSMDFKRKPITRFVDVMPTALKLLDLPQPPTCEGNSLVY